MNRWKFPILASVMALAVAMFVLAPTVVALQEPASSSPTQEPQAQQDPANPPTAMTQAADTQTFTGKIAKAGGKLVLKDNATKMTYSLDDQSQAKKFEGQSVKVTGMLDAQTNTIHVSVIEPGS
jgi:hypothetical protein